MNTVIKIMVWVIIVFFLTLNTKGQTWENQKEVYGKFISTKLSEKYRISTENAPGVSPNSIIYTNNGYGLASFSYPFDGSVIQRNSAGTSTVTIAGRVDKSLIDNGYSNFRIGMVALNVTTGNPSGGQGYIFNINFNTPPSNQIVGNTAVFNSFYTNINQGWYLLSLQATRNGVTTTLCSIKFGIGDVFLIAGQSNARGVPFSDIPNDQVISYFNDGNAKPDGLRVLQASRPTFSGQLTGAFEATETNYSTNLLRRVRLENGLPHFREFKKMDYFTNLYKSNKITDVDGNEMPDNIAYNFTEQMVYPFGGASWAYMPLAKKHIQAHNVPVCFFNFAKDDTNIASWQKNFVNTGDAAGFESNYTVLRKFLNFHGRYSGVRAILWYQGERDITDNTSATVYRDNLNNLMNNLQTDTGLALNWFISSVSYSVNNNLQPLLSPSIPVGQATSSVNLPSKKFGGEVMLKIYLIYLL